MTRRVALKAPVNPSGVRVCAPQPPNLVGAENSNGTVLLTYNLIGASAFEIATVNIWSRLVGGAYGSVATGQSPTGTYSATSQTLGVTREWAVSSVANSLQSALSVENIACTPVSTADVTAPTTPGVPTISELTTSSFRATWTASTDASGVSRYWFQVAPDSANSPGTWGTPSPFLVTSPTLTAVVTNVSGAGLTADTFYWFRVRAQDAAGNFGSYATTAARFKTLAIGAPTFSIAFPIPTLYANDAIAIASAVAGTDIITMTPPGNNAGHNFITGDRVKARTNGALPTGVTNNSFYYVSVLSTTTLYLYDTRAHAVSAGATGRVDVTATGTGELVNAIDSADIIGYTLYYNLSASGATTNDYPEAPIDIAPTGGVATITTTAASQEVWFVVETRAAANGRQQTTSLFSNEDSIVLTGGPAAIDVTLVPS